MNLELLQQLVAIGTQTTKVNSKATQPSQGSSFSDFLKKQPKTEEETEVNELAAAQLVTQHQIPEDTSFKSQVLGAYQIANSTLLTNDFSKEGLLNTLVNIQGEMQELLTGEFTLEGETLLTEATQLATEVPTAFDTTSLVAELTTATQSNQPVVTLGKQPTTDEQDNSFEKDVSATATKLFAEVETTPVKVAQGQPVETDQIFEQISTKIENAGIGDTTIQLSLTPASLGNLTVEITRSLDGSLFVRLNATNPQTASILEKHIGGLAAMLENNTNSTVRIELQQQDQALQQNLNPDGRNGQNQQQHQKQKAADTSDEIGFMQRLRLGLISLEQGAS